jgi:hypothetical protein
LCLGTKELGCPKPVVSGAKLNRACSGSFALIGRIQAKSDFNQALIRMRSLQGYMELILTLPHMTNMNENISLIRMRSLQGYMELILTLPHMTNMNENILPSSTVLLNAATDYLQRNTSWPEK